MKKSFFILGSALLAVMSIASCKKNAGPSINIAKTQGGEIALANGVSSTKGYIDGTTFYEVSVDQLHDVDRVDTPRDMRVSMFLTPAAGNGDAQNYQTNVVFSEDGGVWRHNPPLYWPLASRLDFLAYSSKLPFAEKDAVWGEYNATSNLKLNVSTAYTQDDIVYAAASMESKDATNIEGGVYTVAQPVEMQFYHSQAWLEFQLSVADESMKDKIAIKEIIVKNAYNDGELILTRKDVETPDQPITTANVVATWDFDATAYKNFVFDDSYEVYGRTKTAEDFETENQAVADAEEALKEARNSGIQADIKTAQDNLDLAIAALDAKVKQYELVNPLNAVGAKNTRVDAEAGAETATDCAYLDMLLPQQPKTAFVIRYVLAGSDKVLEYVYDLTAAGSKSNKWLMGNKYIYDIDFVVSEITIAPTVKEYIATFDGDVTPVEVI